MRLFAKCTLIRFAKCLYNSDIAICENGSVEKYASHPYGSRGGSSRVRFS